MLTPDFVKLSHNGASDAQASVYLWVGHLRKKNYFYAVRISVLLHILSEIFFLRVMQEKSITTVGRHVSSYFYCTVVFDEKACYVMLSTTC